MGLLTLAEVAAMTRTSPDTLRWYRHVGAGGPRSFKLGRRVMYREEDVHAWIDEQYAAAEHPIPAAIGGPDAA